MFNKSATHWIGLALKAVVPVILLILISTQVLAAPACKKVKGKFTLQAITGPSCTSAVSVCATGIFTGDFAGTSVFTGTSLLQTVDTPTTGVVFLTADTQILTSDGTLFIKDAISLATTGNGEFSEVGTIIGGTEQWAGYTGQFTATGASFVNGSGAGSYSGSVCAP